MPAPTPLKVSCTSLDMLAHPFQGCFNGTTKWHCFPEWPVPLLCLGPRSPAPGRWGMSIRLYHEPVHTKYRLPFVTLSRLPLPGFMPKDVAVRVGITLSVASSKLWQRTSAVEALSATAHWAWP